MTKRRVFAVLAAAVALTVLIAGEAGAWEAEAEFQATVNQHVFDKIKVSTTGCEAEFKIYFDAPTQMYSDDAPVRNHHRFRARVKMSDGRTVLTNNFYNDTAGKRMYVYRVDSTNDGCWAKKPHRLRKVDVNGCRNRRCPIQPFQ